MATGSRGETPANITLTEAIAEARANYSRANPLSLELQSRAARHLPGGNTRTTLFHGPFPLRFVNGTGYRLRDADGHSYVNFISEYTAGMFGHSHPVIRRAIESALDFGINIGGHTELEAKLAEAVTQRMPNMERVRFTNSGTEANLMNVQAARAFTKRDKILVFTGGYHGGVLYFRGGGSPINVPFDTIVAEYNDLPGVAAMVEAHGSKLACILVEPMFGSTGCVPAEPAFLRGLRDLATKAGALLIFDEVMTSRVHPGGLQALHGVKPDLTTLGKYVGGGMSFGAFGGRADVMGQFDPSRPDALPHAGTFNNNVITMSAGLAGLTQILTPEVQIAMNARGDALRRRLNEIAGAAGAKLQFTGIGSMMCPHFHLGPVRRESDTDIGDQSLRELLYFDLLDRGIYIARRGMIVTNVVHDDAAYAAIEAGVEDFVRVRRRFLG